MSLWWHRGRILEAVAGTLSPEADRRLRGHLTGCEACRGYYDQVSRAAGAFGEGAARARERQRLLAALGESSGPAPRKLRARRVLWAPALIFAAATALVLWGRPGADETGVTWRGSGEEARAPVRLLLHASRKGEPGTAPGPLRFVADLPGAGEGKVSVRDYLQLSYVGLTAPAFVTVVSVDEAGGVQQYVPRPETGALRVEPSARARGLGPSVDLGRHPRGRFRVFGIFAGAAVDLDTIRAAVARAQARGKSATLDGVNAVQVSGVLMVEP